MEKPVSFNNGGEALRGVLHAPEPANGVGVVFLHGWGGNRHGPHRMFVTTARQLAARGCHCLRFDFRGRGESDGRIDNATIRAMIADARCAVDFLLSQTPVRAVILLGICSAGKVAIGEASEDPRITGLALWSAEAMGYLRGGDAKTQKSLYALGLYLRKLANPATWLKIVTGRVNTRMVRKAVLVDEAPDQAEARDESAMLDRFKAYKGRILFIYGGNDPETRIAAGKYTGFTARHGIPNEFHEIAGANHSFYSLEWERQVVELTLAWFERHFPSAARP